MGHDSPPPDPPPGEGGGRDMNQRVTPLAREEVSNTQRGDGPGSVQRVNEDGNTGQPQVDQAEATKTNGTEKRMPHEKTQQKGSQTLLQLIDTLIAEAMERPNTPIAMDDTQYLFEKLYNAQPIPEKSNKKNTCLPDLTNDECELFSHVIHECITTKKMQRTQARVFLGEIVKVLHFSEWTTARILEDRLLKLRQPPPEKPNAWAQPLKRMPQPPSQGVKFFKFDRNVYTEEEENRLLPMCEAVHLIPTKIRPPTDDEWVIIKGLLDGTIVARRLPQFLKRCCNLNLLLQMLEKIEKDVEGELHAGLPLDFKIHPHNQTTARIAGDIEMTSRHRLWTNPDAMQMLDQVKSIAYNPRGHSLHFHFYDRETAERWADTQVPYRNLTLRVRLPYDNNAKNTNEHEQREAALNDPYQRFYRIRIHDVSKYTQVHDFLRYLESHVSMRIKIAYPLDSHGPRSSWSLVWEIVFEDIRCPSELLSIYRVEWGKTIMYMEHLTGRNTAPCLVCGRPGHRARACTATDQTIARHTWTITEDEIANVRKPVQTWTTVEEAARAFGKVADGPHPHGPCTGGKHTSEGNEGTQDWYSTATKITDSAGTERTGPSPRPSTPTPPERAGPNHPQRQRRDAIALNNAFAVLSEEEEAPQHHDIQKAQHTRRTGEEEQEGVENVKAATAHNLPQPSSTGVGKISAPIPDRKMRRVVDLSTDEDDDLAIEAARLQDLQLGIEAATAPHRFTGTQYLAPSATRALRSATQDHMTAEQLTAALRLHKTATPTNGNCQFHAVVEALLKRPIQTIGADVAEDLTRRVKVLVKEAAAVNEDKEIDECAGRLGEGMANAFEEGLTSSERQQRLKEAHREYLKELVDSPSAIDSWLPPRLWGATDTLRLAAKGLGRSIYVLMQTSTLGLYHFKPSIIKRGGQRFRSAGIFPRQQSDWLLNLAADVEHNRDPIILYHANNHYQAMVPMTPRETENQRTKQLSISEFLRTNLDATDDGGQDNTTSERQDEDEEGDWRMLQEMEEEPLDLSQLADATTPELHIALQDPRLTHDQQLELQQILHAESTRRSELLRINSSDIPRIPPDIAAAIDRERRITMQFVEDIARANGTSIPHADWTARKYLEALTQDASGVGEGERNDSSFDSTPRRRRGKRYTMKRLRTGSDANSTSRKRTAVANSSSEDDNATALELPEWPISKKAHTRAVRAWGRLRYMAEQITDDDTFPSLTDHADVRDYLLTYPGQSITLLRAHPSPLYILSLVPHPTFQEWANILVAEQVHVQVHRLALNPTYETSEIGWWAATFNGELTDQERKERAMTQCYWDHLEGLPKAQTLSIWLLHPQNIKVAQVLVIAGLLFPALFASLAGQDNSPPANISSETITDQHLEFEWIAQTYLQQPELRTRINTAGEENDWKPLHEFLAAIKLTTTEQPSTTQL